MKSNLNSGILFEQVTAILGGIRVLDQLNMHIPKGKITTILGKSGVGKSVLLKNVIGLMKPQTGKIFLDSIELTHIKEEELWPIRKKCGLIFQHPALLDSLTVEGNIALALGDDFPFAEKEALIEQALLEVRLPSSIRNRMPHHLSFGMQKRASIARAIVRKPEYLLYDEPTTSLDHENADVIHKLIRSLTEDLRITSVVVSHDVLGALQYSDLLATLNEGKISFMGTANEFRRSKDRLIQDFLFDVEGGKHA